MGSSKPTDIDLFPSDLEFAVFTGEEIRRLSVVKVITGLTFDPLGHPLPGGLYDEAMGVYGRRQSPCTTCLNIQACPGHMGHIELSVLVYNPFFVQLVHKILNISCWKCGQMQMKDNVRETLMLQLRLVDAGYVIEAQDIEIFKSEMVCQNADVLVKLENGDMVHPRIAEMYQLLESGRKNSEEKTKTSCAIRTALVHAATQRNGSSKCISPNCKASLKTARFQQRRVCYYVSAAELKETLPDFERSTGQFKAIFADECRKYLRKIYGNQPDLLKLLFPVLSMSSDASASPVDIFFMDVVPVTPTKSRPSDVVRQQIVEHPKTQMYRRIIENNALIRVVMRHIKSGAESLTAEARLVYDGTKGDSPYEKLYNTWQGLQTSIDVLLDVNAMKGVQDSSGLKQVIEKKLGLIRKHMMGKRVNYAARTVITPDPNINVEEVGIPDIFARKLSYPVPVTPWNVAELRKMVMNGPDVHPGANYIQDEKGYTTYIPADDPAKRESMAKLLFNYPERGIKVVHRHVLNGDIMLLNRQPSLHRPSIMAHKVRILQGEKTFRLHYSNCKSYNADFDGDEMNAHLPQGELARSEAYNIVNVANNYLVPKDGTPLGGLIQDHVISGVKLSIRGRFFNREDYQQLVFQGLSHIQGNIKLLPPTIIKPIMLWSGKQILSTIIINLIPEGKKAINLYSKAKISPKTWKMHPARQPMCGKSFKDEFQMSESEVIIQNGLLLAGVLDKQQYGATTYGLIHCMYELYGGEVSTRLLTAFTKVFNCFLQREGFTLGVQDILVTSEADSKRRKIIKECRNVGEAVVSEALGLSEIPPLDVLAEKMEEAYVKDPKFRVVLDRKYKSFLDGYTNDINQSCLPLGLISKFPSNNLQLMVLSGAKGSMVNTMQISCLLGQIELEGKRPPLMISGKSLPCFTAFETSPKSGGFIDGRFMTGIQPQDFFFHCMAGREGLIDTAVKTSRSGYLQRCLIKHLEGLSVHYDLTVRDSDNTVVQFLYGEDGMDILKSKFFNLQFGAKFLAQNASVILDSSSELTSIKDDEHVTMVKRHSKKIRSYQKKNKMTSERGSGGGHRRVLSAFTNFSSELRDEVEVKRPNEINPKTGRRRIDEGIIKLWKKADDDNKESYRKKYSRCPDPTTSLYKQDCFYGSVSERIENMIEKFNDSKAGDKSTFAEIMYVKNIKSLASPGDPVGLLAAQSIGEPSTQMTLNTFHFAGRGEMNVTLGIPRLREILMLASANIKTPSMDIPIKANQSKAADKLRVKLNRVTVADLLQFVNVKIKLVLQPERAYQYQLYFKFLPREVYQEDFCVRPKRVLKYMSETFFKQLFRAILRTSSKKKSVIDIDEKKRSEGQAKDEEDLDGDDGEADQEKRTKKPKTKVQADDDVDEADSSDEEQGNDDLDATGIKLKSKKQDEAEYDDPDVEEEIEDANERDDEDTTSLSGNITKESADDEDDDMIDSVKSNAMVNDYVYDKENHLWCRLTFDLPTKHKSTDISSTLRELAHKSVIHQVDRIKRAILYKGENDTEMLKTDGINIGEMVKYNNVVDLNRLYTNDIHAIAKTYGIEAAVSVIIKEITNVFRVYGITVDRRHLSLIADYMTFDGSFQPLSRKGMEHSSSPLLQMSFESSLQFLRAATNSGRNDKLNSPSSRLMVGLPVRNGTGAFDLLAKVC